MTMASSFPERYSVLPRYPTQNQFSELDFLWCNVPIHHLNVKQLERRYKEGYHQPSNAKPIDDYQRRIFSLSRSWNIHEDILHFNDQQMHMLVDKFSFFRKQRFSTNDLNELIHEDEWSFALEFYLQMDVFLFYMKTCTYRGAPPSGDIQKNIFCVDDPQTVFAMSPCKQSSCCLCNPQYKTTYRHEQPIVRFHHYEPHTFVNGYRSILNCPVTCTTRNLIYVLTCPCRQMDYIGETSLSLPERLLYHQKHGNEIIKNCLLGAKLMTRIGTSRPTFESLVKNDMKLYQHSAHCPAALQWFLDENPQYWPFIPRRVRDHHDEDQQIKSSEVTADPWIYANDVPAPPTGYYYSFEQKKAIENFFQKNLYLNSPNPYLDLYQATVIALAPQNASAALRRWIEALFITHAETKLNTIGHLQHATFSSSTNDTVKSEEWCRNLTIRIPLS